MSGLLLATIALPMLAWIVWSGIQGHRASMHRRHRLLDEAHDLVTDPMAGTAPDQFPIVSGRIADGRRIRIELIADTLVTRRLPQLWLAVTVFETAGSTCPTLGALARPTGSEYYSLVHGLPEWMPPPAGNVPLLMRGNGSATAKQAAEAGEYFAGLFADPKVKEALIKPNATRIIYQASQGSRAAHMFLRQPQFELQTVPADMIEETIQRVLMLRTALAGRGPTSALQAA